MGNIQHLRPHHTNTHAPPLTPPNDDFADAIVISTTSGSLVGTNKGSTTEVGEPAGENSVWYRWTAPNNGEAHFRIGMDWLTIDVYTGTAINALTRIATSSGSPSAVNWTAVAGTTYRIRLTKNTRTSAFMLFWSLDTERRFRLRDSVDRRERHGHRHERARDRSVRSPVNRWRELGLVHVDPTEQRDCSLPHRHGLAHDRRLHRDGDQRPHPHRDLQRHSERGELDSGSGDDLPDTPHQKHADIGLSFTLDALNRDITPPPPLTIIQPNGGESWTVGQYQNIHWSRQNPGGNTVDIDYSTDNGTTWIRIATQAEDTGWYLWNVPGPATTTAKVRIRFHETPSVTDTSEAVFTIVSS